MKSAASLGLTGVVGTLEAGAKADLLVLTTDDHMDIPYHFGINPVRAVVKAGTVVVDRRVGTLASGPHHPATGRVRRWA